VALSLSLSIPLHPSFYFSSLFCLSISLYLPPTLSLAYSFPGSYYINLVLEIMYLVLSHVVGLYVSPFLFMGRVVGSEGIGGAGAFLTVSDSPGPFAIRESDDGVTSRNGRSHSQLTKRSKQ
jgi:hypothetical protein